ncbi:MAG: DUF4428 domain-containing protein [Oscillospiraceae bacterium]|nr:DUF4428 domain-containing protein [Oscillospiraceae bacterium]MBP5168466.1 DUF4428 domain-containing protein [Oscillospiraceae bacterium]
MGLFDKKYCSICDAKIGLLGNRKLDDGNLCKDCASRLSPWFSDRRHSTVEQIREQLAYRDANKEKVEAFHCTRTLGSWTKVMLDEDKQLFMVTHMKNWKEANPDVLRFSDVTGCDINVDEDRTEVKRKNEQGEEESYQPKRYEYSYDIKVLIHVNNPYFSEIEFKVNDRDIEIGEPGLSLMGVQQPPRPELNAEYRRCMESAEEIKSILTGVRDTVREEAVPKQPVICKACGAKTVPDSSGCCEYCGTLLL